MPEKMPCSITDGPDTPCDQADQERTIIDIDYESDVPYSVEIDKSGKSIAEVAAELGYDKKGCRKPLAAGQWWGWCGETDMGQTEPALCTECGGEYKLAERECGCPAGAEEKCVDILCPRK